jgi:hypothetical protein
LSCAADRPAKIAVRGAILQRNDRALYIRSGLRESGYSHELADLADLLRGDRDALALDMTEPRDREAAEWFVRFLAENQANIRFVARFGKWQI